MHAFRSPLSGVQGLYGDDSIFKGMEQVEDEGYVPSGDALLADIPDPLRPVASAFAKL